MMTSRRNGETISDYHLQAGIAACHCMAPDAGSTDWARILRLLTRLFERAAN